ncbi:FAD-dependent oxidoreductase [Actinoplanes auranticolor]|uniref:Monooxygenase n=1 Tax=Actinoplanes auranticolor TaxID=47988 RepID=A0A919VKX6_9ACTN|nr:FAD-dependent oxidoreductase [Actinoplanes auranticolor]GIM67200.1 monooxygenase [Actinoplanes auranticolor]
MTDTDVAIIGGGQAGLAAAHVATARGLRAVVLDAADQPGGSWQHYYDSLTLFSPARHSALPGLPFPGDPDHYPARDEVIAYLGAYTARLDTPVEFGRRVTSVTTAGGHFAVGTDRGPAVTARAVVAATGEFGRPYRPALPGLDTFTGTVLHSSEYRRPEPFTGHRVVVVGAGNSAVQIAAELATVARVTIATRAPLRWQSQRILGRDFHWWLATTGLDTAGWAPGLIGRLIPVIDDGRYRAAIRAGRPDRRPLFTRLDQDVAHWPGHPAEHIDTVILATGYRPDLGYLRPAAALTAGGRPLHRGGVSTVVPGLGYVGLEKQRSFASATLRGVGRDAAYVLDRLHP